MKIQTRPLLSLLYLLAVCASIPIWSSPAAEARRAYSYAEMYVPQNAEPEVVKPKKKPQPKKRKPISARVPKPTARTTEKAEPVGDLPDKQEVVIEKKETPVEVFKPKHEAPRAQVNKIAPEQKNSPDSDKAKRITLEELLGSDVVKGMSSK